MINIKLSCRVNLHVLVLELRPFEWKLFWARHKTGFGFILGPLGLGLARQETTSEKISKLTQQARLAAAQQPSSRTRRTPSRT